MCKLSSFNGCDCDDYRGAVRRNIHRKHARLWKEEEASMCEDQAIYDREESAILRGEGYRQPEPDEEVGDVLFAAGKEWVQE